MTIKRASWVLCALVLSLSAPLFGQTLNTVSAQERAEGWQLLFDGKALTGWHVSAPPPGTGRAGPAPPPQPGQVGTPKPCTGAPSTPIPAGGSHWEIVDGALTACGEPTGYLTSDRSYKDFVLSIEFKCGEDV